MNLMTAPPLAMTTEQRAAMEVISRSTSLGHRKVVQAKTLLLAADGVGNNDVARRCHTTNDSVRAWAPALRGRTGSRVSGASLPAGGKVLVARGNGRRRHPRHPPRDAR